MGLMETRATDRVSPIAGGVLMFAAIVAVGCAPRAKLAPEAVSGPDPVLTEPSKAVLPTVKVAPAIGWKAGETPTAAAGLRVEAFATGLCIRAGCMCCRMGMCWSRKPTARRPRTPATDPRRLHETGSRESRRHDPQPQSHLAAARQGRRRRRGNQDRLLQDLFSPFGMALVGNRLYIANADAIVSVPYKAGDTQGTATPVKLADLPGAPRNHHWTKSLLANAAGTKFYVGVGSTATSARTAWTSRPIARRSTRWT
jgi:glucose/arabinose dehydrogenase